LKIKNVSWIGAPFPPLRQTAASATLGFKRFSALSQEVRLQLGNWHQAC
jgi:hypothetical protein